VQGITEKLLTVSRNRAKITHVRKKGFEGGGGGGGRRVRVQRKPPEIRESQSSFSLKKIGDLGNGRKG